MVSEVGLYRDAGDSAILECSAPGTVRYPVEVRRISEQTGVNVIMSTGLYSEESWPQRFHSMSTDDFVRYMVDEHEQGIEDTGIKPGNIKVAAEEKTEALDKVTRAAARAAHVTGLAIHILRGLFLSVKDMRWLADVLLDEGADPTRVVFCQNEVTVASSAPQPAGELRRGALQLGSVPVPFLMAEQRELAIRHPPVNVTVGDEAGRVVYWHCDFRRLLQACGAGPLHD